MSEAFICDKDHGKIGADFTRHPSLTTMMLFKIGKDKARQARAGYHKSLCSSKQTAVPCGYASIILKRAADGLFDLVVISEASIVTDLS